MKESRLAVFLVASYALLISGYALVDIARGWPEDAETDALVTDYFCYAIAVFFLSISIIGCHVCRKANWRLLAAIFHCGAWISTGNLFDELFGANTKPSSWMEYVFAGIGVVSSVFEYHRIYPGKAAWRYTKSKIRDKWQQNHG